HPGVHGANGHCGAGHQGQGARDSGGEGVKWRRKRYTKKPHPGRTAVYQFRDAATQKHLYVGVTNNPERRFSEHAGLSRGEKKWWWDRADHRHVTITWYPTRRQALAVE